jgi:poly(hydroxyalkanoate) depolymerase family esterase
MGPVKNPFFPRWLQRRMVSQATQALRRAWHFDVPKAPKRGPAATPGFEAGSYTDEHGTRDYKLFVPQSLAAHPPLLVMLHGCAQDPDDLATGTRMNALAGQRGWLVLYPQQPPRFNKARCWNWFDPAHQRRGEGEPALIAGMARHVMKQHAVDGNRVYAAGMSAGGAMAAVLGNEYPDLFAAVGVHSGIPHNAANSVASAMNVMKEGEPSKRARATWTAKPGAPAIVFHGDADGTVHPRNARQLVDDLLAPLQDIGTPQVDDASDAGRSFKRSTWRDASGRSRVELWEVQGTGHGWSGGDPAGSGTDAKGPDASREMLRFFEQQRR